MAIEQLIWAAEQETTELMLEVGRGPGGRELALARTRLEEAEMWLERSRREHTRHRSPHNGIEPEASA